MMLAARAAQSKILLLLSTMIAIASSFQPSTISQPSSLSSSIASLKYSQRKKDQLQGRIYQQSKDDDNDEPFVFDPLLSPHAYASGTDAGPTTKQTSSQTNQDQTVTEEEEESDDWSPFQMKSVKDDFKGASENEYGVEKSVFTRKWSASMNDILNEEQMMNNDNNGSLSSESEKKNDSVDDAFDPLLSPHLYPKGTSAGPIQKQKFSKSQKPQRIGILLIDHGSRREASNLHLENMASLYQQKAPSNYVIKAAHMEIAKPSILDGIQSLIHGDDDDDDDNDNGVDVVVCHPYFLSPGRHVIEDVPELIDDAQKELKIGKYYNPENENEAKKNVPVVCTGHVGSMMDRMIDMIGEMVNETIEREGLGGYDEGTTAESSSLGGFFGQVQRMIDEQL